MQRSDLLILLLVATAFVVAINAQTCSWSDWSEYSECSDDCGLCGFKNRTRTCIGADENCECVGNSTESIRCNAGPCYFPRNTCCVGKLDVVDGRFACA